jgi:methyl-accepting chemotaxis protein
MAVWKKIQWKTYNNADKITEPPLQENFENIYKGTDDEIKMTRLAALFDKHIDDFAQQINHDISNIVSANQDILKDFMMIKDHVEKNYPNLVQISNDIKNIKMEFAEARKVIYNMTELRMDVSKALAVAGDASSRQKKIEEDIDKLSVQLNSLSHNILEKQDPKPVTLAESKESLALPEVLALKRQIKNQWMAIGVLAITVFSLAVKVLIY